MSGSPDGIRIRPTPVRIIIFITGVICFFWLLGRIVPIELPSLTSPGTDTNWSKPVAIGGGRYGASLSLHYWNGIPVGVARGGVFYFLNKDDKWIEKTIPGFASEQNESCYPVVIGTHDPRAIFCDIIYTNKTEAAFSFVDVTLTPDGNLKMGTKVSLPDYQKEMFKDIPIAADTKREISFGCQRGAVVGTEFYIPYSAYSEDMTEIIRSNGTHQQYGQQGPSEHGFLYSSNGLPPWQQIRLDRSERSGTFHAASDGLYLFTVHWANLWSSTQLSLSNWAKPKLVTDTLKGSQFQAEGENGTTHLCWLDERLKRGLGFFIYGDWDVGRRNNLVYYRNNTGGKWSHEKRLSGNLSYCGNPSMSTEGENTVVAWDNYTTSYTRASIYYTFSKNNGRTWSRIYKIENPEDAAGSFPSPNVVLYHGIIHLFYDYGTFPDPDRTLMYQWRKFPD